MVSPVGLTPATELIIEVPPRALKFIIIILLRVVILLLKVILSIFPEFIVIIPLPKLTQENPNDGPPFPNATAHALPTLAIILPEGLVVLAIPILTSNLFRVLTICLAIPPGDRVNVETSTYNSSTST